VGFEVESGRRIEVLMVGLFAFRDLFLIGSPFNCSISLWRLL
jgi:hypothetical protein